MIIYSLDVFLSQFEPEFQNLNIALLNYSPRWIRNTYESISSVTQSCRTLCDPMDCSPSGSSVHGIFQARILEWVAISFFRGSFQPRNLTQVSCIAGRLLTIWATMEVAWGFLREWLKKIIPFPWHQGWEYYLPHFHIIEIPSLQTLKLEANKLFFFYLLVSLWRCGLDGHKICIPYILFPGDGKLFFIKHKFNSY